MSLSLLRERATEEERLDQTEHDPRALRLNMVHLAGVSRWLGAERSIMRELRRQVENPTGQIRVLDVGTGGADLLCNIVRALSGGAAHFVGIGLDRQKAVADIAVERSAGTPRIRIIVGDGVALPISDDGVDISISSTTLHHLSSQDAVRCVREMARVARRLVIVGDLERSVLALIGAHVLAGTWWRRSSYRLDGPLSVRKAFTRSEMLGIGRDAGLVTPRVYRYFPFRLVLVGSPAR